MLFQGLYGVMKFQSDHNQSLSLCCSDRTLDVVSRTVWCDEVPVPERHQIHGAAQCLGFGGPCRTDEEEKGTFFFFFQFPSHRVLPCMLTSLIRVFFLMCAFIVRSGRVTDVLKQMSSQQVQNTQTKDNVLHTGCCRYEMKET